MRVGVFDSGVGGLSVVKSLMKSRLFSEIIYYGDTARVPYGTKDTNTVIRYSLEALEFFSNFEIELMIVACNSATAAALPTLQQEAPFAVYGVIEPGVIAVENLELSKDENILVIGTQATIRSNKYQSMLQDRGYGSISAIATPLLVPLVEEGIKDSKILTPVFNHYFSSIPKPKVIILGCTHFPLLMDELKAYFNESTLIHSGDAIVEYLKRQNLQENATIERTQLTLFASENAHKLKEVAANWIDE
jgi:glutamate racemase